MNKEKEKFQEKVQQASILGVPYFNGTQAHAVAVAEKHLSTRAPLAVFTPGATVAARATRDGTLLNLLKKGDLILPDGKGCLLAARLHGCRLAERIAGIDFAEALFEAAEKKGARVFLYGAKEGVAERAAARLRERYPRLIFASAHGYGGDPAARVAAFCPHISCVCLGAGKQEAWIDAHKNEIGGVLVGLGGSIDVWAGRSVRAPRVLRRLGLEWAYRVLREPRRIPRLFPLPAYFWKCLRTRSWSKCQKKE